jgi:hypothetical protein
MTEFFSEIVLKYAPWSTSKAGTLERCPRNYVRQYIDKAEKGISAKTGKVGTAVHYVLERGLLNDNCDEPFLLARLEEAANKDSLLQEDFLEATTFMVGCVSFIERIRSFKLKHGVKQLLVENKLAMLSNFTPCDYKSPNAFMRGIVDLSVLTNDNILLAFDHKTGKPKDISFHYSQMYTYAVLSEVNSDIKGVQCIIHYVGEPELSRMQVISRDKIQSELRPWMVKHLNSLTGRLEQVEAGIAPAIPSVLCSWCSYLKDPDCDEGISYLKKKKRLPIAPTSTNL